MAFKEPYRLEERKRIEEFIKLGLSGGQIAKAINRSKNGVNTEIKKNGGREAYNGLKAQENFINRMTTGYEKLALHNKGQETPYNVLRDKIAVLEMQVEILFELTKKGEP